MLHQLFTVILIPNCQLHTCYLNYLTASVWHSQSLTSAHKTCWLTHTRHPLQEYCIWSWVSPPTKTPKHSNVVIRMLANSHIYYRAMVLVVTRSVPVTSLHLWLSISYPHFQLCPLWFSLVSKVNIFCSLHIPSSPFSSLYVRMD